MLQFDKTTERFTLNGVAFGPGTRPEEVEGRLPGRGYDVPGPSVFRAFDTRSGELVVELGFRDGVLESGIIYVATPEQGSWEQHDAIEAWRHGRHEVLMRSLFGASAYASPRLEVRMVREPRELTEEIRFRVL